MPTVRQAAQSCNAEYEIARCLTYYTSKVSDVWSVQVEFSARQSRSAGFAHPDRGIILNARLMNIHGEPKSTLLHEVAHMLQHIVYGRMDHGYTFHEIMHRLGQPPARCHSYNLQSVALPLPDISDLDL